MGFFFSVSFVNSSLSSWLLNLPVPQCIINGFILLSGWTHSFGDYIQYLSFDSNYRLDIPKYILKTFPFFLKSIFLLYIQYLYSSGYSVSLIYLVWMKTSNLYTQTWYFTPFSELCFLSLPNTTRLLPYSLVAAWSKAPHLHYYIILLNNLPISISDWTRVKAQSPTVLSCFNLWNSKDNSLKVMPHLASHSLSDFISY